MELTRAIPSLVQWRQQDCAAAFNMAVGACPEWRDIKLYATMQDMVASVNASAFVGRELGTDQKWIRAVDRMPMAVAIPTIVLSYLPALLRPVAKPFLFFPLKVTRWNIKRMLRPVLEKDIREYESSTDKKDLLGPKKQGKVQLTGWLLARYKGKLDIDVLVQDYITLSFESTPSTASTLFFVVCELAADPALQDVLRQELQEQADHGRLPRTHLNELRKMDSVMRESARVNPFSYRKSSQSNPSPTLRQTTNTYNPPSRALPQTPRTHQALPRTRATNRHQHLRRRPPHQQLDRPVGSARHLRRPPTL